MQQVPPYVIVGTVILIPITVAIVNYIMVVTDLKLLDFKFQTVQSVLASSGFGAGTLALLATATPLAFVASSLVVLGAPTCAGSGIPEVLGFLNGNFLEDLFTLRGFIVRTTAIVLVQVAGFPVGREGPMVAIGGTVGFGVAWLVLRPTERRWEQKVASPQKDMGKDSVNSPMLLVNEERFAYIRRVGCALGGAAGIATAFNAPIGAILYMFEELAVSSLPPDLAKFMCTVFASLAARALLHLAHMDVHRLVIYEENGNNSQGSWEWADVPLMIILSVLLGFLGAFFSKMLLTSWGWRRRISKRLSKWKYLPLVKIVETTMYCGVCSLAWALVPALFDCRPVSSTGHVADDHGHTRLLASDTQLSYVQYTCPDGQYNEVASYFLSGAEGAVKHLYSQGGDAHRSGPLAVALLFYFTLACGMPGLAVPMGTFVPSMLSGALAGRLIGENLNLLMAKLHGPALASAGIYAVVGSAAVLAGLTHMTVGIVALLAEAIGDFGLIIPLMLSVYVAQSASKLVSNFGYDEHLIQLKGIPFLDPETPKEMESERLTAESISEVLPEAILPEKATVRAVKRALRAHHGTIQYFPIISQGSICVGLTTRGRLKAVVKAVGDGLKAVGHGHPPIGTMARRPSLDSLGSLDSIGSIGSGCEVSEYRWNTGQGHLHDLQAEAKMKKVIQQIFSRQKGDAEGTDSAEDAQNLLPLTRIMDNSPHMLNVDMPISRFYNLFNKMGADVAVVISDRGKYRGVITRSRVIEAQTKLHEAHKGGKQEEPAAIRASTSSTATAVATAVAGKMRPEELREELRAAAERMARRERLKDQMREELKACTEERELLQNELRARVRAYEDKPEPRASLVSGSRDSVVSPPISI